MAYEAPDPYGTTPTGGSEMPPPDGFDVTAEGYRPPDLAGWWDAVTGAWRYILPSGGSSSGGPVTGG